VGAITSSQFGQNVGGVVNLLLMALKFSHSKRLQELDHRVETLPSIETPSTTRAINKNCMTASLDS